MLLRGSWLESPLAEANAAPEERRCASRSPKSVDNMATLETLLWY